MIHKKSKYNIEVEKLENGNALLYNTYTGAFGILDKETEKIYNLDIIDKNQITDERMKLNIDIMHKNGFLVESNLDEYKRLEMNENALKYKGNGLATITIAPTLDCNMACPYCYEKSKAVKMDEKIKLALLKFLEKYITSNNLKAIQLTWYGGEPLLELNTIRDISKALIDICKSNEIIYTSFIVTNGALLDYNTAKILREECLVTSVQITLDGVGQVHNATRTLKSGEDSFKIITDNIENAKEILNIVVRSNISKDNKEKITELVDFFSMKNWHDKVRLYFAPVDSNEDSSDCTKNSCYTKEEFSQVYSELQKDLYSKGLKRSITYPRPLSLSCSAISFYNLVIDPEGEIYRCWHVVGKKENTIGNVKDGIVINQEFISWITLDHPEKCKECKLIPLCRSGCPQKRINDNKPFCDYQSLAVKGTLKKYYNIMQSENSNV